MSPNRPPAPARPRPKSAAAQQKLARLAAEHTATRNKKLGLGFGLAVVIVVVALVVARVAVGHSTPAAAVTHDSTVYEQVAAVPASVINAVGSGGITPPTALAGGSAITKGGKPEVAYVGAEFCPYCAAERWTIVQALSRFGTFSNLGETRSSATDVDPSTATFDFDGSSYTSPYLSFAGYEAEDGTGKPLETPSPDVEALFNTYARGFPFADLGGTTQTGVSYDPGILAGLSQQQIAADLSNPKSRVAQAIVGSANAVTKQLCALTHDAPSDVCTAPGVTAAA